MGTKVKIHIRALTMQDVDALHAAVRGSIAALNAWLPWCHPDYGQEDARRWVEFGLDSWMRGAEFPMGVFGEDGALLGSVGLNKIDPVKRVANLGYWVRSDVARRGIATAAARQMAAYGFQELGFERLEIVVLPGNAASIRVAEKLGAKDEGIVDAKVLLGDRWVEARVFSLAGETL